MRNYLTNGTVELLKRLFFALIVTLASSSMPCISQGQNLDDLQAKPTQQGVAASDLSPFVEPDVGILALQRSDELGLTSTQEKQIRDIAAKYHDDYINVTSALAEALDQIDKIGDKVVFKLPADISETSSELKELFDAHNKAVTLWKKYQRRFIDATIAIFEALTLEQRYKLLWLSYYEASQLEEAIKKPFVSTPIQGSPGKTEAHGCIFCDHLPGVEHPTAPIFLHTRAFIFADQLGISSDQLAKLRPIVNNYRRSIVRKVIETYYLKYEIEYLIILYVLYPEYFKYYGMTLEDIKQRADKLANTLGEAQKLCSLSTLQGAAVLTKKQLKDLGKMCRKDFNIIRKGVEVDPP